MFYLAEGVGMLWRDIMVSYTIDWQYSSAFADDSVASDLFGFDE